MKNYKTAIIVTILFMFLPVHITFADIMSAAEQGDLEQEQLLLKENP